MELLESADGWIFLVKVNAFFYLSFIINKLVIKKLDLGIGLPITK